MRVAAYLNEQGIPFETILHPPAFTAPRRAKYLGLPGQQVAKSILFAGPHGYFLVVLPATHQVDTEALGEQLGGPVRMADEHEIAEVFHDCEWGLVTPFGSLYGLPTILEELLAAETFLVLESQARTEAIRMSCRDYERLEQPRRLRFASRERSRSDRPSRLAPACVRLFCPDTSWA